MEGGKIIINNIRWVVQNNLIAENDLKEIQNSCSKMDIEFEEIEVIPFSSEAPNFTIDEKINIYYGSTTLIDNIYNKFNAPPGIFFNESFSMENYINRWKAHMLNSDAKITDLKTFCHEDHPDDSQWFIRPDADDKSFAGDVMAFEKIKSWSQNIQKFDNVNLSEETKIIVATPWNIKKEWRCYIVDGKVVASTLYRENFRLKKSRKDIPNDMIVFAEARCQEYMPHKIFAMDIALCGEEYYIIECGCMNSVGFYDADIIEFVKHISQFMSKNN